MSLQFDRCQERRVYCASCVAASKEVEHKFDSDKYFM